MHAYIFISIYITIIKWKIQFPPEERKLVKEKGGLPLKIEDMAIWFIVYIAIMS